MIRLVILTEIISPYRIPLFNALARRKDVDLHVVFLAETDPSLRQWQVYKDEIKFAYQVLPSWRRRIGKFNVLLNRGVNDALSKLAPDVILCGGYSYAASWQTLRWARTHKVPVLLWSESNLQDSRGGHRTVEFLKKRFLRGCQAFVVPGRSAREYLRVHGIDDNVIFTAPNAVDNDLFAAAAAEARRDAAVIRSEWHLPERYFLFVGRLVREKGVFELLSAYATLDETLRRQVGLVFVGDGAARKQLREQAAAMSPGDVIFTGFAQRDLLAGYYALAETLILPTHSDTWGLVVNEGMACGLPIIVSSVAGCVADLVKQDWNGLLVPPGDLASLARAMDQLARDESARPLMACHSLTTISAYSPEEWSLGVAKAIGAGNKNHD